ncbi:MAG TPA: hypothetical protein VHK24_05645 [Steroidobacter sp.]|nr:hypothetical protein [Steroidobacter sp.]
MLAPEPDRSQARHVVFEGLASIPDSGSGGGDGLAGASELLEPPPHPHSASAAPSTALRAGGRQTFLLEHIPWSLRRSTRSTELQQSVGGGELRER